MLPVIGVHAPSVPSLYSIAALTPVRLPLASLPVQSVFPAAGAACSVMEIVCISPAFTLAVPFTRICIPFSDVISAAASSMSAVQSVQLLPPSRLYSITAVAPISLPAFSPSKEKEQLGAPGAAAFVISNVTRYLPDTELK